MMNMHSVTNDFCMAGSPIKTAWISNAKGLEAKSKTISYNRFELVNKKDWIRMIIGS